VTHYDVLGVRRTATPVELRQAYLRLVRDHHPDRHAGSSPEVRADAELRTREVNEAWHTLSDAERRRRYDASLDRAPSAAVVEPDGTTTWEPFDLDPDLVDERLDDSRRPPPRGGRLLAMGPPVVLTGGAVAATLGLVLGWRALVAVGAMGIILGGALFVLASLSVVLESRQNDLR
jgi:hypothetical protein